MKKTKQKRPGVAIVRRAIQLFSFILMPGLFISIFSGIKAIYTAVIGGTFNFAAYLPQMLMLLAVTAVTVLLGRFFCGFLCSFGAMGDLIWFISRKVRKKNTVIGEKTDRVLKLLKYAFLLFIVIFIWTLGAVSFDNSLNPWNIFGMYTSLEGWTSLSSLLSVGALLLGLIILGSFFIERFFCRYLCPLGAVLALLSKLRILKVRKPAENCGSCHACTSRCSMGIPMYRHDKITSGECINCFECLRVCPQKNAQAEIAGNDVVPLAVSVAATAAIMGMCYIGNISENSTYAATPSPQASLSSESGTTAKTGNYIDGTYTGSAPGYRGETSVQVTVENGNITNIEVLSTDDDVEFFNRAEYSVINAIIETQLPQVDAVTGATYSSNAIMDATADALSVIISTDATETAQDDTSASASTAGESTASASQQAAQREVAGSYTDGVYTGTGSGFRGDTEVTVTVSGGSITDIEINSYQDDRKYFERASDTVITEIISQQSVDVDTVSGCTFSSNGILEAVADALNIDFTNPNSTLESGHGGFGHGSPR